MGNGCRAIERGDAYAIKQPLGGVSGLLTLRHEHLGIRPRGQAVKSVDGPWLLRFLGLPCAQWRLCRGSQRQPVGPSNDLLATHRGFVAADKEEQIAVVVAVGELKAGAADVVGPGGQPD